MRYAAKDKADLYKRLHAILPEYRPISEFNGKSGSYKAVDADGRVFLVTWTCDEDQVPRRSERFLMDYAKLVSQSDTAVAWFSPEDGWTLED
jgi:hypothetical protein